MAAPPPGIPGMQPTKEDFGRAIRQQFTESLNLSERCFHTCVDDFSSKTLNAKENLCVYRCIDKYFKFANRVAQTFVQLQQQQQQEGKK